MTSVQMLQVTPAEWVRRKEFAGFTAEDERLLADLSSLVNRYVDEVVDELYAQFFRLRSWPAIFFFTPPRAAPLP